MNLKRGFNRLYVVLVVILGIWCLLFYPLERRGDAFREHQKDEQICYAAPGPLGLDSCLQVMKDRYDGRMAYESAFLWRILLPAFIASSLIAYGLARGMVAIVYWIKRGFHSEAF